MSHTDEVMENLSINIRKLNENINDLRELKNEIRKSNTLKQLELGLLTGMYSKDEVNNGLRSIENINKVNIKRK